MYKNKRLPLRAARMLLCLVISASRYRSVTGIGFSVRCKSNYFLLYYQKTRSNILRVFRLVNQGHFVDEVACASDLLDCEEDITNVKRNVAADLRVEYDVAHGSFPYTVEVKTD